MNRVYRLATIAALICCLIIPAGAAAQGKALRLGNRSDVIAATEKGRSAETKDLTSDLETDTKEKKGEAKGKVKDRLKGYSLVAIDMKSAKNKKELELVTEAASELGIDVVLEDTTAQEMADLYGIGVDATAVVVKTDPATRKHHVYPISEEDDGELGAEEPEVKAEKAPAWADRPEKEQKEAEKMALEKGLKQSDKVTTKEEPGAKAQKSPPTKTRKTKAQISKEVDEVLKKKIPKGRDSGFAATGTYPPDYAFKSWVWYSNNNYNLSDGVRLSSTVNWEIVLFAAKSPAVKRIQIFTTGPGANAYPLAKANNSTQRYYYLRQWETIMDPNAYWTGSGWNYNDTRTRVRNWNPRTANRETTSSYTSGWSIDVGASKDGPEVGGSYSQSETHNVTVRDFELRGAVVGSNGNAIRHTFTGSKPSYSSLENKSFCDVSLHGVPSAAWDTFGPEAYSEWEVSNSENGYTNFYLTGKATYGRVEITSRNYDWTGCLTSWYYRDWAYWTQSSYNMWIHWGSVYPGT